MHITHCTFKPEKCGARVCLQGAKLTLVIGKGKLAMAAQSYKTDNYTLPLSMVRAAGEQSTCAQSEEAGDLKLAGLLEEIQGSHEAMLGKIDIVAIKVNLLCDDMQKISERVIDAEGNTKEFQQEIGALKKTVATLQSLSA
ncbi:hypothetical protein NDU88_002928 [Pleurodeles waltl]|uniref:Uncharacterized protein n=1 Tax=Pleurodeles waltl TaxID=8319 RepID=A0AAV7LF70_PLEWA|nr:hypothetical protein NDU88_002928 [Pleurodeles waltl]